nr:zinc finger, CCHC-type [Tanacetum cinerariifolium]
MPPLSKARVVELLTMPTPPPSSLTLMSSPLPQIPSPPPMPSSPLLPPVPVKTYALEQDVAAALLMLPSTTRKSEVLEADMPPQKRLCFATPITEFEVGESSAVVAARPPRDLYGSMDTTEAEASINRKHARTLHDTKHRMMTAVELINLRRDRASIRAEIVALRDQGTLFEDAYIELREDLLRGIEGVVGLSCWFEKMKSIFHISGCVIENQVKFSTCTMLDNALTWWNGHLRTLGHDAAYAMTWEILKKKMTDKYYPRGEIKKLEIELWNLKFRNSFSSTTMGDKNPICTLGDYYKPSHEGYMNTIELPIGNNMVPLRSETIRLVQNGCSFHGLWSKDPNQHLKDFLKLVDPLNLDGESRDRTCLRLFQFSLRDQASNWLKRLPAGSITTWEDLTT